MKRARAVKLLKKCRSSGQYDLLSGHRLYLLALVASLFSQSGYTSIGLVLLSTPGKVNPRSFHSLRDRGAMDTPAASRTFRGTGAPDTFHSLHSVESVVDKREKCLWGEANESSYLGKLQVIGCVAAVLAAHGPRNGLWTALWTSRRLWKEWGR